METDTPGSPERDRYIFRDGKGPNGDQPPTNWESHFGGPAWTRVPDGQWYLHMFTKEQPDWNWNNREVRDDFLTTLHFWLDHGADGFRVDVAHGLAKDLDRDDLDDYVVWCTSDQPDDGTVVPEFLRTLVFARPRGDDQFADCTFSPSLDMSR